MFKRYLLFLAYAVYLATAYSATTYTYKTVGDLKVELDVYLPSIAAPASGYPVFFTIHGGAYVEGSKQGSLTVQEGTEALNRGWAIVSIDYRMLPGVVLDDIVEDVQDAYKWVRTELVKTTPINPDLITVFGQSAGGGLAVISGYKLSPRPQAVIGFFSGCTNWTDPHAYNPNTPVDPLLAAAANKLSVPVVTEYTPTHSSDPRVALWTAAAKSGKMGWLAVTHDPNASTDRIIAKLKDFSAVDNVDENYPPTYLAHGLIDQVVPYSQSVELANVLEQNNIPYVLDLVPGANHGFDKDSIYWQQHILPAFDFAQKYMQSSGKKIPRKFLQNKFHFGDIIYNNNHHHKKLHNDK